MCSKVSAAPDKCLLSVDGPFAHYQKAPSGKKCLGHNAATDYINCYVAEAEHSKATAFSSTSDMVWHPTKGGVSALSGAEAQALTYARGMQSTQIGVGSTAAPHKQPVEHTLDM